MPNHLLFSVLLTFVAVTDVAIALWLVPRIPDERRGLVMKALLAGALIMMALAISIGFQLISLG